MVDAGMEEHGKTDAERAVELFRSGMEPSQIDAVMGMQDGWAHDAIVRHWARDKAYYGKGTAR